METPYQLPMLRSRNMWLKIGIEFSSLFLFPSSSLASVPTEPYVASQWNQSFSVSWCQFRVSVPYFHVISIYFTNCYQKCTVQHTMKKSNTSSTIVGVGVLFAFYMKQTATACMMCVFGRCAHGAIECCVGLANTSSTVCTSVTVCLYSLYKCALFLGFCFLVGAKTILLQAQAKPVLCKHGPGHMVCRILKWPLANSIIWLIF